MATNEVGMDVVLLVKQKKGIRAGNSSIPSILVRKQSVEMVYLNYGLKIAKISTLGQEMAAVRLVR